MPVSLSKFQASASAPTAPGILGWLKEHLGQPRAELHTKLRGNILHVLCETPDALEQSSVLLRLVRALLEDRDQGWLHQTYPQVYQIYLYSRRQGQPHPDWTAPIYLNRLERHLAQLVLENQDEEDLQAAQTLLASYAQDHPQILQDGATGGGAMVLSNLSLARKGDPEAIAWYLSETLSALDVGVWVSVKAIPGLAHLHRRAILPDPPSPDGLAEGEIPSPASPEGEATIPRLWILCEAAYSPDPSLIARPTAERLRRLQLTQFKDAVLLLQVRGEAKPDWSLRIDLTPPEEMLREWSRWGDVASLGRLMASILERYHLTVETTLNGDTLHVLCQPQGEANPPVPTVVQSQSEIVETLSSALEELAPQGIHRAILYGQPDPQTDPTWVHYLDLPAAQHSALADSPEYLGQMGDLPALAFLLTRQLNPNLEDRLATGGQRVQLLQRDQLLHIMVDGPVVPQRRLVAPLLNNYLLSLSPVGLEGVRIYGRRSGQLRPAWSYGRDFAVRRRLIPAAAPEFTASDAYVNELLVRPDSPITHADISPEAEAAALAHWWTTVVDRWQEILVQSQIFSRSQTLSVLDRSPSPQRSEGLKIAAVWATVGVLLALQADWLLGQMLRPPANAAKAEPMVTQVAPPPPDPDAEFAQALAELDWPNGQTTPTEGGFVDGTTDLFASPSQPLVAIDDLVADSPFSTFNSEQMNEKLALYRQRLATEGPADVMIVGSSRALRGVDPEALRRELAALGYENLSIFNFGINGATAQVVDLVLRQALTPEQLPRLILWADGARAFNSGREDVTYNAIVASPGYRELMTQRPDAPPAPSKAEEGNAAFGANGRSLPQSYAAMDEWLSDRIGEFSAVHPNRDSLKTLVQSRLGVITPAVGGETSVPLEQLDAPMPAGSALDRDGFLPLSVRFNPATYYQTYARVSGRYDGDYEDFRLDGAQVNALNELLRFTQDRNIPIVFINTPLSDEYLDDYRQAAEEEFLRHMLTLSTTESGFLFRDLGQAWPDQYDYFSDPSHLNRYGAYQVSQRLAQDPLIAWPRRSSPPAP
ncbi:DUF1574 domain-containing protein [Phormidium sp. FACHB-1136]|uniref:DUF1574 domain-containing protein n=1 Tax=Phormidium sp. FACHB-1136 TaxID=2692848 RepID=UPI00168877F6|nr:DUF1574 domain-containing protein [Phormidium sp. FACHB-1136]MBD2427461.1 DUF1574 domain-containing protein [Phormidium sp. FACHB-1136]